MSEAHIPAALRRDVIARARNPCEYCGMPDDATLVSHEVDHVVAERHGGKTDRDNLAYSCFRCNRLKGTDLTSIDPQTGKITRLFDPRADKWQRHYRLAGSDNAIIEPLTAVGRTTAQFLRFNDIEWIMLRAELQRQGRYAAPAT